MIEPGIKGGLDGEFPASAPHLLAEGLQVLVDPEAEVVRPPLVVRHKGPHLGVGIELSRPEGLQRSGVRRLLARPRLADEEVHVVEVDGDLHRAAQVGLRAGDLAPQHVHVPAAGARRVKWGQGWL